LGSAGEGERPGVDAITRFRAWKFTTGHLRSKSARDYESTLRILESYAQSRGWGPVEKLTEGDIRAFASSRAGYGLNTRQRELTVIREFYKFLSSHEGLANPSKGLRISGARVPREHSVAGLSRRIQSLESPIREWALFLRETADTGIKLEEAYTIKEHLPVGPRVRVRDSRNAWRHVSITRPARRMLDAAGGRPPWKVRYIQRLLSDVGLTQSDLRSKSPASITVDLHPDLESELWSLLEDGEYESASQKSLALVEGTLRRLVQGAGGRPDSGVHLIDAAFGDEALLEVPTTARVPLRDLFSGARYFRNELSHDLVEHQDPSFAREVVLLADLLLRLLDRVVPTSAETP
jgi:uncharacterized protein (TIGR02391 family)